MTTCLRFTRRLTHDPGVGNRESGAGNDSRLPTPDSRMKSVITGSGIGVPKNVVRNDALTRLMDTTDEWIRTRSGIEERRYADAGHGSAELGSMAAQEARTNAGRSEEEIDAIVFARMAPNLFFRGQ